MVKVLIVDDSAFMRKILKNILVKAGYADVVEATNGQEAVAACTKDKPDLVLLDIIMEKKDGIEALKEIKVVNGAAKVVMVSAVGQEKMVKEAMDLGADDFIVKPFDGTKVTETVKKILE